VALSNTTLGALLASINASIMLIALPDVFRGIGVNPLQPGNGSLLLWLVLGYLVVTAVLVASFGRPGNKAGRVWIYNLGLVVFTVFLVLLAVTWLHGTAGGAMADRDAGAAGCGRGDADGQLLGDPHRGTWCCGVGSVRGLRHGLGLPVAA
jgi:MFS family permease